MSPQVDGAGEASSGVLAGYAGQSGLNSRKQGRLSSRPPCIEKRILRVAQVNPSIELRVLMSCLTGGTRRQSHARSHQGPDRTGPLGMQHPAIGEDLQVGNKIGS